MQPYRFVEKKFSSCVFRNLDGSLPSAMISDVILIFPPNLRGLPNAKWSDLSDRWCGRLKRLKAAMTWFSLLLERQLKRAIRQDMSSKTLSLVRVRVWRTMAFIDWYTLMERGGWGGEQRNAPLAQRWPTVKGTDKISRLKIFFLHIAPKRR